MRSLGLFLIGTYVAVELSSFLILAYARHGNLGFESLSRTALSDGGREAIRKFIDLDSDSESYFRLDPDLGWTLRPGGRRGPAYGANHQGLRSDREYPREVAPGQTRALAFGGSFTHGDEVANPETWEEQMTRIDPSVEVLNFGVTAYGIDQAYLRFEAEVGRYDSRIVLIGFMSDDIDRSVSRYRPFYFAPELVPRAKPRFLLRDGRRILVRSPLPALDDYRKLLEKPEAMLPAMGQDDFWYSLLPESGPLDVLPSVRLAKTVAYWMRRATALTLNPLERNAEYKDGEALRVTEDVLKAFYLDVQVHRTLPVIVLFPSHADIRQALRGGKRAYQPLIDFFRRENLRFVDLLDAFGKSDSGGKPGSGMHYTPDENGVVARFILNYLKTLPSH